MSDDSSNNDGFVVRSRPDAGIVVETRPLTPAELAALDVGDFFTMHPSTMRVVSAVVRRELTAAECTVLLTPRPTLLEAYRDGWLCVLPFVGVVAASIATGVADYWTAAIVGVAASWAAIPLGVWRRRVHDWQRARDAVAERLARRGTP